MAVQPIQTLKGYFNRGDKPSESNFSDLIDTIFYAMSGTMVINIDSRVAYSCTGDPLHFALDISTTPSFSSYELTANSYINQSNWQYFNNITYQPFVSVGLLSTYQNTTYGGVTYTWINVPRRQEYYIRYRSWDGTDYSNFKTEKRCL